MKLFYKPGACSLASHIVMNELNLVFELERVDTERGLTESQQDYLQINPKGYVPALALSQGEVLSEGVAILQYLADQHASFNLAPNPGTFSRARLQEYLNYISSELHKAFSPLFAHNTSEQNKVLAKQQVGQKLTYIESVLSDGRDYLLGTHFSVADAYLFAVVNWCHFISIDLNAWPHLYQYYHRIRIRPSVQKALHIEGILK